MFTHSGPTSPHQNVHSLLSEPTGSRFSNLPQARLLTSRPQTGLRTQNPGQVFYNAVSPHKGLHKNARSSTTRQNRQAGTAHCGPPATVAHPHAGMRHSDANERSTETEHGMTSPENETLLERSQTHANYYVPKRVTRILCTAEGIYTVFYNVKSIAFKNCESLYCTPVFM